MALKNGVLGVLILGAVLAFSSCRKETKYQGICLHNSSVNYFKNWAFDHVNTQVYNASHKLLSQTVTVPNGYFEINSDFTYYLYSDNAPIAGKWNINNNCQFVVNPGAAGEQDFEVIQLSDDSLTLQQTSGFTVTTQHYKAYNCPNLPAFQARWDLAFNVQSPYGVDTVFKNLLVPQMGYLMLNPDASYNSVLEGNPPPPPTTGTWGIANPGCMLVLDKNKPNERSYEVQKINNDSLVIWRKDTVAKQNLLRHYFKHKQ